MIHTKKISIFFVRIIRVFFYKFYKNKLFLILEHARLDSYEKDADLFCMNHPCVVFLLSNYLYLYCSSKRLIHHPSAVPATKRTGQASTPATPNPAELVGFFVSLACQKSWIIFSQRHTVSYSILF